MGEKRVMDSDEIVRRLKDEQLAQALMGCNRRAQLQEDAASHILALKAELASVKAHAEAMAAVIEPAAVPWGNIALEAYRAAHPKDAP